MKQQILQRTANGLIAQPNPITAGEGSCTQLENCVIDREGICSKRRGYDRYASISSTGTLSEFKTRLIVHDGSTLKYDDGTGTLTSYSGSYSSPDSYRMRFHEQRNSLFYSTSGGVYKIDSLTGTPRIAGMPRGLDIQCALDEGGSWFLANYNVAYKLIWLRKDVNNRLVFGTPTWKESINNDTDPEETRGVSITSTIPDGVIAGDYYELYRTTSTSGDVGDELFRVIQKEVTSSDITNGYITYLDTTDDAFLYTRLPLYTNADEDGPLSRNDRPPYCVDMCYYKGYTYYFNTKREPRCEIRLTDIAGITDYPDQSPDSITITLADSSTLTFTFATSTDIENQRFKRWTSESTLAENVRETMKEFCKVVNRYSGNTDIYAHYTSEDDDPSGMVQIITRNFGEGQFSITATSGCGDNFDPALPTSGTTVASDDQAYVNRMCWSKYEQPEHVPEANYRDVGIEVTEKASILRGIALQASLIILKQDGVWRQTGETADDFDVRPLDPSIQILAKDSACLLDNNVYCMSRQGLVWISENGVAIISWPIEHEFKKIFSFNNFQTISHAIAYQSDRKYIIWTQEANTDTYAKIGWVFNHLTAKWTTWRKSVIAGHVLFDDDKLYLMHASDGYVLKERKSYHTTLDDYKDESISTTISNITTVTGDDGLPCTQCRVTYSYDGMDLVVGFALEQSSTSQRSNITSVTDLGSDIYEIIVEEHLPALVNGSGVLSLPIVSYVRWKPETCGNPAIGKFFSTVQIFFENDQALKHDIGYWADHHGVGYYNDSSTDITYYTATLTATSGWGLDPWGDFPWGNPDPEREPIIRMTIPSQFARCRALTVIYRNLTARENFNILNMALTYRPTTEVTSLAPR